MSGQTSPDITGHRSDGSEGAAMSVALPTTVVDVGPGVANERLELVEVTKRYKNTVAVRDVNLRVVHGEFVTFLGQSGSGKTTTLKLIAGFETCDSGSILLGGHDVSHKAPRDRDIGMVFQHYALFPHMTVAANVGYGLRRRGWPAARATARIGEMLELTDLTAHARKVPHQLSGGQQQRVALARALAPEPKLLLMDEPLGALDRALRLDLESEIRRIHRSTGCTIIYVTHDRDEALALSDRIAVFHAGAIVGVDEPMKLYDSPPTVYVARLLTDANIANLPASHQWRGDHVEFELGGHRCRFSATHVDRANARLAIPRRAIRFSSDTPDPDLGSETGSGAASGPRLPGVVTDVVFLGDVIRVDLMVPELGPVVAHVPHRESTHVRPGGDVLAHIDIDLCRVVA